MKGVGLSNKLSDFYVLTTTYIMAYNSTPYGGMVPEKKKMEATSFSSSFFKKKKTA